MSADESLVLGQMSSTQILGDGTCIGKICVLDRSGILA